MRIKLYGYIVYFIFQNKVLIKIQTLANMVKPGQDSRLPDIVGLNAI